MASVAVAVASCVPVVLKAWVTLAPVRAGEPSSKVQVIAAVPAAAVKVMGCCVKPLVGEALGAEVTDGPAMAMVSGASMNAPVLSVERTRTSNDLAVVVRADDVTSDVPEILNDELFVLPVPKISV